MHPYSRLAVVVKMDVIASMSAIPNIDPLPRPVMNAWIGLMRAQRAILAAVEGDLRAAGLPPLGWYDVLIELHRAPEGRLRPYEIEQRTLMAQYNLSRLLDRLEDSQLVRKDAAPEDRRGRWIAITDLGRQVREQMWEVYRESLRHNLAEKLDEREAEELSRLLGLLLK